MKARFLVAAVMVVWLGQPVWAQETIPSETPTPAIPKPESIPVKERIPDGRRFGLPRPPSKYVDGTSMDLEIDVDNPPFGPAIMNLGETSTLAQVPTVNKNDNSSGKYYWHPFESWNYCHFPTDNRHWYGWRTGNTFHWVLWWQGRLWWRDDYADRWLYFNRGYWWWQNPRKGGGFQVFLPDGHYHVCDANGALGDDLMRTGKEEVVTEPVAKPSPSPTPGGKHGGRHHRS